MASAKVSVDDWVEGRLPKVCAVTGVPTSDTLRMRTTVDPPTAAWWLLVLLGPIGWIAVAIIFGIGGRSHITGVLPMSEAAFRSRRARRLRVRIGFGVFFVAVILIGFVAPYLGLIGLLGFGLLLAFAVYRWSKSEGPFVELDGSRRWVTIKGVHPHLAAAIDVEHPTRLETGAGG